MDISHGDAHTIYGTAAINASYPSLRLPKDSMVVDVKKLSDALRSTSPEDELRRDLERLIGARRQEIHKALAAGQSYVLRVPDGRRLRISPRTLQPSPEPAATR